MVKPQEKTYNEQKLSIPVGVSNRHVHLSSYHLASLFGEGYGLEILKKLSQPGEFASKDVVSLVGPKGTIEGVRVLGPIREQTQVEISMTDTYQLGIKAPVRLSGNLAGTPGIILAGPKGFVTIPEGLIVAARHIHLPKELAQKLQMQDETFVRVHVGGVRAQIFENVIVRVKPDYNFEFHIDTDEANGTLLKNGQKATLLL